MGLITSVNNIQYELEKQKEIRLKEQKEKRILKYKKENLEAYKNELETFLQTEFDRYFTFFGTSCLVEFYSKENKEKLLNSYFDTIKNEDKSFKIQIIPFKKELTQHFQKKYDTILKKCYKEQEQEEIYQLSLQEQQINEQKQQEESDEKLVKAFKIAGFVVLGIIFFPLLFILSIIFGIMKSL